MRKIDMAGLLDDPHFCEMVNWDDQYKWHDRYKFLIRGKTYIVIKEFVDFDNIVHAVGEEWLFLGQSYLYYDAGRSLFVSLDGVTQYSIRMWETPEGQGFILDNLHEYIAPLENGD